MAKRISDEDIKLNIIINGNDAQKEISELEKSTINLKRATSDKVFERKLIEKQLGKESLEYKRLTEEINRNNRTIDAYEAKLKELVSALKLTDMTMAQLKAKAQTLSMTLNHLTPNSEDHRRYTNELQAVRDRMNELSGGAERAGFSIKSLADKFNQYSALGATVLAFLAGFVVTLQSIIDLNGKLSDAQTNVQKTTGMTKQEVDELTKSFGALKTRTGRIELLGIAEVGGRLGIAKEEIKDFVRVMDKSAVALGDAFEGGPEVVADKLGKIKGLYEELKKQSVETAFESVGSALNDLGAAGTASEGNMAEFMTRIGAMPEALKPTVQEALGLGAAFEESGLKAEVAASNYSKVITIASRDYTNFAKVMGVPAQKVKELINSNPTEFFLQFSKSLKGLDATELSKILDYLKLNDNEVKQVLGAASQNTELFRQKIKLAADSMKEATSLTKEYNLKNTNLAAIIDKLKKSVAGWFSSDTVVAWLTSAVEWFAKFVGAIDDADSSAKAWRNTLVFLAKMIAIVVAATLSSVAADKLAALWKNKNTEGNLLYIASTKLRAFYEAASIVVTQAYAAVTMLLTGNIKGATQAIRVMATTMKTTPLGLFVGLLTTVVVAYQMFKKEANDALKVQQMLNSVHLEATKSIAKEKSELSMLTKIAKDEHQSKEARLKAIEKLNKIVPDYIGHLSLENIKTAEGSAILKEYTRELYKNARAKAVQAKYDDLHKQRLEIEQKTNSDYNSVVDDFFETIDNKLGVKVIHTKNREEVEARAYKLLNLKNKSVKKITDRETGDVIGYTNKAFENFVKESMDLLGLSEKEKELKTIDLQLKALEPELVKNKVEELKGDNGKQANGDFIDDEKDKKKKKAKKYNDDYLKDEQKASQDILAIRKKAEEMQLEMMEEGFAKEMEKESINNTYRLLELKNQLASEAELKKLDKLISEAKDNKDFKKVKSLENYKRLLLDKNKEIFKEIEYENDLHQFRMGKIEADGAKDSLDKLVKKYQNEKVLRETEFLKELNSKQLSQAQKELLTKKFQEKELLEEEKHLKNLLEKFNKVIGKEKAFDFDLSLLSPEQVKLFEEEAAKVGLTLQELIQKRKELQGQSEKIDFSNNETDLGFGNTADIFGFTADKWKVFQDNIEKGTVGIQTMQMAVSGLMNMWGKYNDFLTTNENNQLREFEKNAEAKKAILKNQLDKKLISQNQYNKQVEKADKEVAKKKAEIEYDQAVRKRDMSIVETVINTATAIMQAYSQLGPIGGTVAAALIGVLGAVQISTIASTPLPSRGYEEGLYPDYLVKREQDGKVFKARNGGYVKSGLVSKPTHFLAGENGPEMIIDSKAYDALSPNVREALVRELRGIKGFENGYYKKDTFYTGESNDTKKVSSESDVNDLLVLVAKMIKENTEVLSDLRDNGLEGKFYNNDLESMKNLKRGMEDYTAIRNKNKF